MPDGASQYVVARVAIFDERLVIQRMLSRCGSSEEVSSDEEHYTYSGGDPPSAPTTIAARQQLMASPRRADVDADMALPKESYSPRQILVSSKGTQLISP